MSSPPSFRRGAEQDHLDEITCMLFLERQLERARALEVSAHTQTCDACRNLLRVIERESRLLTRAMLEEEEPLPARIAQFQESVRRSMQWIWLVVFGLASTAVYAIYAAYIELPLQRLEEAGFGGTSLVSMLIFQGSFWKGWQSMISLIEVLALITVGGLAAIAVRKRFRRGSAMALMLTALCGLFVAAPHAGATEFRKGASVEIPKDETVKGDVYFTGQQISVDGTIDGDLFVWGQEATIRGHVTGDLFVFAQTVRVEGQVDGNLRGFCNNVTVSGTVNRNMMAWAQTINVDSRGSVARSLTSFSQTLSIDGKVGTDLLIFNQSTRISGTVGGGIEEKGETLTIEDTAKIDGPVKFEGEKEPVVSPKAKLASQVQFTHHESKREEFGRTSVFWTTVIAIAYLLYAMALFLVLPQFGRETVSAAENVGGSLGLGLLVFFGVLIGSMIAMVTLVGLFVGFASLFVWFIAVLAAQPVAGALLGQWILGRTKETWPAIGRMILGIVLIRMAVLIPHLGWLIKLAMIFWGLGAISIAIYRRFQPPTASQPAYVPPSVPVGPVAGATA